MTTPSHDTLKELMLAGKNYYEEKQYDEARKTYQQTLKICKKAEIPSAEAVCHRALGMIYEEQGNSQKALHHYEKASQLYHQLNDATGEALMSFLMAQLWEKLRLIEVALPLFRKAVALYPSSPNSVDRVNILMQLGS